MTKRELRTQAEELRRRGWSVPAIAVELGVAPLDRLPVDQASPTRRWRGGGVAEKGTFQGDDRRPLGGAPGGSVFGEGGHPRGGAGRAVGHNPSSVRRNVGEQYHGCLIVRVRRPTRLYWRIEGIMNGLLGDG